MVKQPLLETWKRKIFVAVKKHSFGECIYNKVNRPTGSDVKNQGSSGGQRIKSCLSDSEFFLSVAEGAVRFCYIAS